MTPGGLFSELHDCVCGFQGKDVFSSIGSKGYKPEAATCAHSNPCAPAQTDVTWRAQGIWGSRCPGLSWSTL